MAQRDSGHPDAGDVHPVAHHGARRHLPRDAAVRLRGRARLDPVHRGAVCGGAALPPHPSLPVLQLQTWSGGSQSHKEQEQEEEEEEEQAGWPGGVFIL